MFLVREFLADKPSTSLIINNAVIQKSSQKLFLAFHPRCLFNVVALPTILGPTSVALAKLYHTNFLVLSYLVDNLTTFPILNDAAILESSLELYLVRNSRPHPNVVAFPTIHRLTNVALGKLYPSMFLVQDFLADRPSMYLILNNAAVLKSFRKLYLVFHPLFLLSVVV